MIKVIGLLFVISLIFNVGFIFLLPEFVNNYYCMKRYANQMYEDKIVVDFVSWGGIKNQSVSIYGKTLSDNNIESNVFILNRHEQNTANSYQVNAMYSIKGDTISIVRINKINFSRIKITEDLKGNILYYKEEIIQSLFERLRIFCLGLSVSIITFYLIKIQNKWDQNKKPKIK